MWRDIFLDNKAELLRALDAFERVLADIRGAVEAGAGDRLQQELERCRAARTRLRGPS
jgi:prephenate dehydrogenase